MRRHSARVRSVVRAVSRQIRCFGSTTLSGRPTRRPHCPKDCGVGARCDKRLTRDDAAHGLRCAETTMSSRACHAAMRLEAKVQAWSVIMTEKYRGGAARRQLFDDLRGFLGWRCN